MEISIKHIGHAKGTVGWLARGLEDGTLILSEGTLHPNGQHSLWIKGPNELNQFLAAYNVYNLDGVDASQCNARRYTPAEPEDADGLWTPAAWRTLRAIADKWCEECNKAIDSEQEIGINIVRVAK